MRAVSVRWIFEIFMDMVDTTLPDSRIEVKDILFQKTKEIGVVGGKNRPN